MASIRMNVTWKNWNAFFIQKLKQTNETIYNSWKSIIMHLPYAFQGRRMLSEIYALDPKQK
jgi:hydroxymethylglutaryl-CoA synthase